MIINNQLFDFRHLRPLASPSLFRGTIAAMIIISHGLLGASTLYPGFTKDGVVLLTRLGSRGEMPREGVIKYNHHERFQPGSLLKPFAAVFLLEELRVPYNNKEFCAGWKKAFPGISRGCWHREGHGVVDLQHALSESCNYYFYTHLQSVDSDDYYQSLVRRWGFPEGMSGQRLDAMIGDGLVFALNAQELIYVYSRLFLYLQKSKPEEKIIAVRNGLSGQSGTLAKMRRKMYNIGAHLVMGKTGTSRDPSALHRSSGTVILFFQFTGTETNFALLVHLPGKMGSEVASQDVPRLLRHWLKQGILP